MHRILPSLDLIKGFEAAARNLSITRAAEELFVTQSAVSRQVKALEAQLGVALFQRRHRALLLTEAGQELYRSASAALKQLSDTASRIKQRGSTRIFTVSATIGFISLWLIPRLADFRAAHPEIDIRLDANNKMLDLQQDGIEVAIRYCSAEMAPAGAVRLFGEEVTPVCSPGLITAVLPLAAPEDLRRHVLLHYDRNDGHLAPWLTWTVWLEVMQVADFKLAGSLRFSQYDQVIQAAVDGQGVALGSRALVHQLIRQGKLVAPLAQSNDTERSYYLLTAPDSETRADVQSFIGWLLGQARWSASTSSA